MKIRRATWLLLAALAAGCASQPGSVQQAPAGAVDVALGKTALTVHDLRDLPGLPDAEQRRRLDVVLAAHPDDLGARFFRTQGDVRMRDFESALTDSDALLADSSLDRRVRLLVLEWRAEALIQVRRLAEAILVANQALEIDDSDAEALFARGWARFLGDNAQADSALADLDRGLQRDPDEGVGWFRHGTVLRSQGKLEQAAEDFERAAQLMPDDAPNHLQYGVMLLQMKQPEQALVQFDAVARLTPHEPSAWTWRAQANASLRRYDDSSADAKRAIESGAAGEDLANARIFLASGLEQHQDFAGAAREFQLSLALDANPVAADGLARMQWYTGQFAQALDAYRQQATRPNPHPYAPIWLFLVRERANPVDDVAAKGELAALAPSHQPHAWTDTLVDLMLGKSTLPQALAEADAASTDKQRAGRRCEADYYAAELLLVHDRTLPASRLLEEAHAVCPATYIEANAIVAEQRLLAAKVPAP